jgi:hypothetical protein
MVREEGGFIYQDPKRLAPWLKRVRLLRLKEGEGKEAHVVAWVRSWRKEGRRHALMYVFFFLVIQGA